MPPPGVEQVRRFNRTVSQRIGALDDRFLSTGRPLGEARVLWEIGADGCEVRALRSRLDLDAGYLSRLLRALEDDGLVRVAASEADRRIRMASLTAAGRAEWAVLDERSDGLAASLLEPLTESQRERLLTAMRDVERLLTAALVELRPVDPEHPDARQCVRSYFAELARRSGGRFDPATSVVVEPDQVRPPAGLVVVAYLRSDPVGCGAVKQVGGPAAEIKRMWVSESARGLGIGRRLLTELESRATAAGAARVRLDTSALLHEAIALYRSAGYAEVPAFTDEPFADHWFAKRIRRSGSS